MRRHVRRNRAVVRLADHSGQGAIQPAEHPVLSSSTIVGIDQLTIFENSAARAAGHAEHQSARRARREIHQCVGDAGMLAEPRSILHRALSDAHRRRSRDRERLICRNHTCRNSRRHCRASLSRAGYASALVGKYHLGRRSGSGRLCAPQTRGFSYFTGIMTAGPPSVDTTAGGVAAEGSQVCGYYQTQQPALATPRRATPCAAPSSTPATPIRRPIRPAPVCSAAASSFPTRPAASGAPQWTDFKRDNGYYAWPRTTLNGRA